jgi:tetratricopeptide (TPR) repeat protein
MPRFFSLIIAFYSLLNVAVAQQDETIVHKVSMGETLQDIADLYDIPVATINSWNRIVNNQVFTNQPIIIKNIHNYTAEYLEFLKLESEIRGARKKIMENEWWLNEWTRQSEYKIMAISKVDAKSIRFVQEFLTKKAQLNDSIAGQNKRLNARIEVLERKKSLLNEQADDETKLMIAITEGKKLKSSMGHLKEDVEREVEEFIRMLEALKQSLDIVKESENEKEEEDDDAVIETEIVADLTEEAIDLDSTDLAMMATIVLEHDSATTADDTTEVLVQADTLAITPQIVEEDTAVIFDVASISEKDSVADISLLQEEDTMIIDTVVAEKSMLKDGFSAIKSLNLIKAKEKRKDGVLKVEVQQEEVIIAEVVSDTVELVGDIVTYADTLNVDTALLMVETADAGEALHADTVIVEMKQQVSDDSTDIVAELIEEQADSIVQKDTLKVDLVIVEEPISSQDTVITEIKKEEPYEPVIPDKSADKESLVASDSLALKEEMTVYFEIPSEDEDEEDETEEEPVFTYALPEQQTDTQEVAVDSVSKISIEHPVVEVIETPVLPADVKENLASITEVESDSLELREAEEVWVLAKSPRALIQAQQKLSSELVMSKDLIIYDPNVVVSSLLADSKKTKSGSGTSRKVIKQIEKEMEGDTTGIYANINLAEITVKSAKKGKYNMGDIVDTVSIEKAEFYLSRAKIEIDNQNFKRSHYYVDKSIEANPNFTEAYMLKADLFARFNFFDIALVQYENARKTNDSLAQIHYNIGNCLLHLGQKDMALLAMNNAVAIDSNYVMGYFVRSSILIDYERYDEAIEDFNRILKNNKFFFPAMKGRGLAYLNTGNYSEAISDFDKSLEFDPDDFKTYYHRGLAKIYSEKVYSGCMDLLKSSELGFEPGNRAVKKYCN